MLSALMGGWKVPSGGMKLKGMIVGTVEDRIRGRTYTFSGVDFNSAKQVAVSFQGTQH